MASLGHSAVSFNLPYNFSFHKEVWKIFSNQITLSPLYKKGAELKLSTSNFVKGGQLHIHYTHPNKLAKVNEIFIGYWPVGWGHAGLKDIAE